MSSFSQNLLNLIVAIIVGAGLWYVIPAPEITTRGILLPSGQPFGASNATVNTYDSMPSNAIIIGSIRTLRHFDDTTTQQTEANLMQSIDYAKQLAQKNGANGIVINRYGLTPGGVNPLDGFILYATAIRT